jgi:phosphatidylinositol kinase/protein kinase (PI-3  family)
LVRIQIILMRTDLTLSQIQLGMYMVQPLVIILHPYMHFKMKNKAPGTIDPDDIILMRTSEMYLIEAEAEAMQGSISQAQAALQALGRCQR